MKRLISVLMFLLIVLSTITSASAAIVYSDEMNDSDVVVDDSFSIGDVDNNGSVNAKDSLSIKCYITDTKTDIAFNEDAADIDASGSVNARDALYLKASIVGKVNLSDFDNDKAVDSFTIAGNSITEYSIVLNEDFVKDADNATAADGLLRKYIIEATGVIVQDYIGTCPTEHMIRIVRMDPLANEEDRMGLGIEDYIYEVRNGDLYIYGTLRGCMYAVYEILEEYLGFVFFSPEETFEYEMRTSDIPEGTYVYHKTQTNFRFSGQRFSSRSLTSHLTNYYYAQRLNGTQVSGGCDARYGYQTGPLYDNAHTFSSTYQLGYGYYKMLDEDHSDEEIRSDLWYCKSQGSAKPITWQPCASSYGVNSDYYYMIKGLELAFDMYIRMGYHVNKMLELGVLRMSFSINDNLTGCTCRYCQAKIGGKTVKRVPESVLSNYGGEYTTDGTSVTFKKESFSGTYIDLTNHAAEEIRKYYPEATLWTIIYDHTIPESIRPAEGVSIMYCGHECMQHLLGSGECGTGLTVLGSNNNHDEANMKWWADTVHAEGGYLWFWSYAVNYNYYFLNTPDVLDFWNNYNYLMNVCGFDGVYYEGASYNYNFEGLKSYLSGKLLWDPQMTYDEFIENLKEYLYIYYGGGVEEIYEYIIMTQEAGDATGYCFITNHDRPWDMYSWQYLSENYEKMRSLLEVALTKANSSNQRERVKFLIYSCDFMGISSAYDRLYYNGTEESRNLVVTRITELYNYFSSKDLPVAGSYALPDELNFEEVPMNLFYEIGAWRTELIPDFAK